MVQPQGGAGVGRREGRRARRELREDGLFVPLVIEI